MPVLTGKRYFISYKNEDTARVGEITRRLNQMGVPMWYDYGIEKGENWSREINRNIDECEAIVVFASKTLFAYEDTYVRKEFRLADIYEKKIYVVWLENVTKHDVNKQSDRVPVNKGNGSAAAVTYLSAACLSTYSPTRHATAAR